jgi:hypothetical protein
VTVDFRCSCPYDKSTSKERKNHARPHYGVERRSNDPIDKLTQPQVSAVGMTCLMNVVLIRTDED